MMNNKEDFSILANISQKVFVLTKPLQGNPRYSAYKFNLHSVTIEVNIVTSSVNIEIISAGWPAEQPATTS